MARFYHSHPDLLSNSEQDKHINIFVMFLNIQIYYQKLIDNQQNQLDFIKCQKNISKIRIFPSVSFYRSSITNNDQLITQKNDVTCLLVASLMFCSRVYNNFEFLLQQSEMSSFMAVSFFLVLISQTQTKSPCGQNCNGCRSFTECVSCSTLHMYILDGRCYQCPSNCSACNSKQCLVCYAGSFLNNGSCQEPRKDYGFIVFISVFAGILAIAILVAVIKNYEKICRKCKKCKKGSKVIKNYEKICRKCKKCKKGSKVIKNYEKICRKCKKCKKGSKVIKNYEKICRKCKKCKKGSKQAEEQHQNQTVQRLCKESSQVAQWQNMQSQTKLQELCVICQDSAGNAELNCKHRYHLSCIRTWVKKRLVCPLCRTQAGRQVTVICTGCCKSAWKYDISHKKSGLIESQTCPNCIAR